MNRFGGAAAMAAGVVLSVSGCGVIPLQADSASEATEPTTTILEDAAGYCEVADDVLRDEGESLTFDTMGEDDDLGDDLEIVACVLTEIDAPDYVVEHIDSTRALDGQQTDSWDSLEARWSYHPDSGLNLTLIDRS